MFEELMERMNPYWQRMKRKGPIPFFFQKRSRPSVMQPSRPQSTPSIPSFLQQLSRPQQTTIIPSPKANAFIRRVNQDSHTKRDPNRYFMSVVYNQMARTQRKRNKMNLLNAAIRVTQSGIPVLDPEALRRANPFQMKVLKSRSSRLDTLQKMKG